MGEQHKISMLSVDGQKVTYDKRDISVGLWPYNLGATTDGGVPEGAVFSPDGRWLYVGNYTDKNISVLRVDGDKVVDTGVLVPLPDSPASMRGRVQ